MSHVEQTATKNWRIKAFYKLSVSTGKKIKIKSGIKIKNKNPHKSALRKGVLNHSTSNFLNLKIMFPKSKYDTY